MEKIGDRIKRIRKAKGLTQAALALACGWDSQSRIGNYEKYLRAPSVTDLTLIATALGVTVADLLGESGSGKPNGASHNSDPITHEMAKAIGTPTNQVIEVGLAKDGAVPVVGMAKLGVDGFFEAIDFPVGHGDGYLLIGSSDPNAYGLKVLGESMHPRIKNGEYVLIEPNKPFVSGDDVMVKTIDGRAMIKEFIYLRDGTYRFDSVNSSHPPLHFTVEEVEMVHLVGGILKSSRFVHC